ncbi:MAG: hypothetical protein EAX95_02070 [Candidatus Thorarchaeota archaeon]|nr:hypothetical protein [Candidatus Thorarchaeota archaeon]
MIQAAVESRDMLAFVVFWGVIFLFTWFTARRLSAWARPENRGTIDDLSLAIAIAFGLGAIVSTFLWGAFQILFYFGEPLETLHLLVFASGSLVSIIVPLRVVFSPMIKEFKRTAD